MKISKELLIDAIVGSPGPEFKIIQKYVDLKLGEWVGGFYDTWRWFNKSKFEHFTEEQLFEIYTEIKDSWK